MSHVLSLVFASGEDFFFHVVFSPCLDAHVLIPVVLQEEEKKKGRAVQQQVDRRLVVEKLTGEREDLFQEGCCLSYRQQHIAPGVSRGKAPLFSKLRFLRQEDINEQLRQDGA